MSNIVLKTSTAAQKVPVYLVDDTDGKTPELGVAAPTIEISKNGAGFAAPAAGGAWAEVGYGWYTVTLDAADTNAAGWIGLRVVKAAVSREFTDVFQVSDYDGKSLLADLMGLNMTSYTDKDTFGACIGAICSNISIAGTTMTFKKLGTTNTLCTFALGGDGTSGATRTRSD